MDKNSIIIWSVLIVLTIGAGLIAIYVHESLMVSVCDESEIVEGHVTDVTTYEDYIEIEFNGNQRYKIKYPDSADFTVNSELVVKLKRSTYKGIFIEADKEWRVDSIIKVPRDE